LFSISDSFLSEIARTAQMNSEYSIRLAFSNSPLSLFIKAPSGAFIVMAIQTYSGAPAPPEYANTILITIKIAKTAHTHLIAFLVRWSNKKLMTDILPHR
jgi:hypothetical protein